MITVPYDYYADDPCCCMVMKTAYRAFRTLRIIQNLVHSFKNLPSLYTGILLATFLSWIRNRVRVRIRVSFQANRPPVFQYCWYVHPAVQQFCVFIRKFMEETLALREEITLLDLLLFLLRVRMVEFCSGWNCFYQYLRYYRRWGCRCAQIFSILQKLSTISLNQCTFGGA